MNAYLHHILIALVLVSCVVHISICSSTKIVINDSPVDENCTRLDNGTLVCPCNVEFNGTFYPCWMELTDSVTPTPSPLPNNTCVDCPAGSYSNISTNLTCHIECVPGACIIGAQCPLCARGYYNPYLKQQECFSCNAGATSDEGALTCTSCGPGTYADHPASPACKSCPVGWATATNDSTICTQCSAGTYSPNTGGINCLTCDVGTYSAADGAGSCAPCDAGYFNPYKGASGCNPCDIGFISHSGATECTPCALGTASNADSCVVCDSGLYANAPTDVCFTCPAGQFSPVNKSGVVECLLCEPGKYASETGSSHCIDCAAGTFTSARGKDKCSQCPSGSYCPFVGTVTPKSCPKGFYCKQGSISPAQCATLYHANSDQTKCVPSPSFYLIIFGSCLGVIVVGLIAWRIRVSRRTEARRQNKQLEIDRLIPKPREGPVYSGW